MPRLKFDLKPFNRDEEAHYRSREENDDWVRNIWKKWNRPGEPAPCDCGYYGDQWLVTCDARDRLRCKADMPRRLEASHRDKHERFLRSKRVFPGTPFNKGPGWCRWCGAWIVDPKTGEQHRSRTWCAHGDCLHEYNLRTDLETQRAHLLRRDGLGCFDCGDVQGAWAKSREANPEVWRNWGPKWERRYPADVWVGELCTVAWNTRHEVDHFIALAVAFECFPDDGRRRWFFSPANLRLLCASCHKAKTNRDRALLREIANEGPEHGKAVVLGQLRDAGLLKGKPL